MKNKIKFRRYKISYKKRYYYIFIPFDYSEIWLVDWADWWYGGAWLEGSINAMKYIIATFAIIAFNPFAIVYFPIRKNRRPNTMAFGNHANWDVIFKSTHVWIKDKDLRKILKENLKYTKHTTYNIKLNLERMERYFSANIKKLEEIPPKKILKNSDNHLFNNFAIYTFAQEWYQREVVLTMKWFKDLLESNSWRDYYYEKVDVYQQPFRSLVYYGKKIHNPTYKKPYLTMYIELYDIKIMNKYLKKDKIYLVDSNKIND